MKKVYKLILLILAIFCLAGSTTAFAECDGFYLAGRAGFAKYEIEDKHSNDKRSDYVIDKKGLWQVVP